MKKINLIPLVPVKCFCGSDTEVSYVGYKNSESTRYYVRCVRQWYDDRKCFRGPEALSDADAIEMWNKFANFFISDKYL